MRDLCFILIHPPQRIPQLFIIHHSFFIRSFVVSKGEGYRLYYLGVDLGGTNIAVGLVDEDRRIINRESVKTVASRGAEGLCREMAALCRRLTEGSGVPMADVAGAGVGTPGVVWDGVVSYSSNLGLRDAPLAALLARELRKPVHLENDARAAAYGEYAAGAGMGCHSMVIVTIGTGIGSGIIVNGKIHRGFNGAAGELGHTVIVPGGRVCPCGKKGCAEAYCSAGALTVSTRRAMGEHPESAMWRLGGGDVQKADAKVPFIAMRQGDEAAKRVVDEFIGYLALCASNAINLLQPEVFCIGGGVSKEGDAIVLPLRGRVEELTFAGRDGLRTKIVAARLGNDAGIIGAALLGAVTDSGGCKR